MIRIKLGPTDLDFNICYKRNDVAKRLYYGIYEIPQDVHKIVKLLVEFHKVLPLKRGILKAVYAMTAK